MAKQILQDKRSIMNLFAAFMANSELLGKSKEYKLSLEDFPERYHKVIYGAMANMYEQGVTVINPVEIDTYLSTKDNSYRVFTENDGLDYLYKVEELGTPKNVDYHYSRVKKYSFLRACQGKGIDVTDILDPTVVDLKESEKQLQAFDEMTLDDMIKHIEVKYVDIKDEFKFNNENQGSHMSDGIEEMLEGLYDTPSYGASLSSGLLTRILRGARKNTFMIRSAPTGIGKSRVALADLCAICIHEIWDLDTKKWVQTGANGKGVFITTELTKQEIQLPTLCYISGVPEWKVLDAKLDEGEKLRLKRAVEVLDESSLYIEHLNDFDIEDIEATIERNVVKHGVEYVCFDYIHSSIKLMTNMTKSSRVTMREDQVLLLMSDKIKQMCNKYGIWILSGTQLNNEWKAEGGKNLDASSLRGARALGDKVDAGMIMLAISAEDEKVLDTIRQSNTLPFGIEPNMTVTIFKNRRGEYNAVKVWLNVDLGNLRTKDLFVTTADGKLIPEIKPVKVKFKDAPVKETPHKSTIIQEEYDELPESFNEEVEEERPNAFATPTQSGYNF